MFPPNCEHSVYRYTGCGRKSSHGYLLFLGLACAKTFFRGLYICVRTGVETNIDRTLDGKQGVRWVVDYIPEAKIKISRDCAQCPRE